MLNMALLLRVVNEGEHVVVNQVAEEVNPSIEVGSDTCGADLILVHLSSSIMSTMASLGVCEPQDMEVL